MSNTVAPSVVLSSSDTSAMALVATIKSSVNGASKYTAYVTDHAVTRENVKDHATALAVLAYPNDDTAVTKVVDGQRVRTRFGNAAQAARAGLVRALPKRETVKSDPMVRILKAAEAGLKSGLSPADVAAALAEMGITLDATTAALAA